jgi:gamma-glutamyl-gamma-aminobutyrate hydrolase PuuD
MVFRVGIPTMPLKGSKNSYITVKNVEWLEKAGVTVVPIPVSTSLTEAKRLCRGLSGIFLQGGPQYDRQYIFLVRTLLKEAIETRIPVWGTCHGFQMLVLLIGGFWPLDDMHGMIQKRAVLKEYDTKQSQLYRMATKAQKAHLHKPVAIAGQQPMGGVPFSHENGITLKHFLRNKLLCHVFRILTITKDAHGTDYVSSMEGIELPFWGVQYHPELDHQLDWMATFFKEQMKPSNSIGHHTTLPKKTGACPDAWQEGEVMCYSFRD